MVRLTELAQSLFNFTELIMLALYTLAAAFSPTAPTSRMGFGMQSRSTVVRMVDIPRITLPAAASDVLKEQSLKNPNGVPPLTMGWHMRARGRGTANTAVFTTLATTLPTTFTHVARM